MKLDRAGLEFLKEQEGVRLESYKDVAGYETIGVGHLLTPNEKRTGIIRINEQSIPWRATGLTEDQALGLLAQDAANFEAAVNESVDVALNQNQFNALVSLAFNIGPTAFVNSTLVRVLNEGDYDGAAAQFAVWRKAGGRVIRGLVLRRARECELFEEEVVVEHVVGAGATVIVPRVSINRLIDAMNKFDDVYEELAAVMEEMGNFLTQ